MIINYDFDMLMPWTVVQVEQDTGIWVCSLLISLLMGLFYVGVLLLNSPEKYHYLKQSGCYGDPSINDKEDFNNVMVCQL